jgi:hypothetical protein
LSPCNDYFKLELQTDGPNPDNPTFTTLWHKLDVYRNLWIDMSVIFTQMVISLTLCDSEVVTLAFYQPPLLSYALES